LRRFDPSQSQNSQRLGYRCTPSSEPITLLLPLLFRGTLLLESRGCERGLEYLESEATLAQEKTGEDRRHSDRFPIERDVRYRVLSKRGSEESGEGKTLNISSSGILFKSEHTLLPGRRLEVAVSWPAQLNNKCALKLVARGRIVRFEEGCAAMEIQQYEFRTQSAAGGSSGPQLIPMA
jgi:hypothetical protein